MLYLDDELAVAPHDGKELCRRGASAGRCAGAVCRQLPGLRRSAADQGGPAAVAAAGRATARIPARGLPSRDGIRPRSSCPAPMRSADPFRPARDRGWRSRSEEHTSELQSLMRISYAVFCLKKKKKENQTYNAQK